MNMKRIFGLLIVLVGAYVGRLSAQTVSFNFSRAAHAVSGWTNIYGDPAAAVCSGTSGGITVSSVATTNWAPTPDTHASFDGGGASGGTFFPAAVMANTWYQYSNFYAQYNALVPQLVISGLNKDSVYTIKMTGSDTLNLASFHLNPIRYTVTGAVIYGYVDINGESNTSDGAVFHNIAPDASGTIKVYVNTYNNSNLACLCGIQIITGHTTAPQPVVAFTHPSNNQILSEDGIISLAATASETGGGSIARVEFYANDVLLVSDSAAPYTYSWTNADPGSYTLKARAIDGFGNTAVATINVTVQSLNYFWSTTGNIATGADSSFVGTVDTNRLAFRTNNVERMTILKDGTIGIGTKNTYGYALAVNGTGIFTKVRVKTAGTWPDYVFKKGYELPDLQQLERYVTEHKHLPGIVSEGEVARDGFDLGDHQAALLKKVEELTLYLIKENRRLKEQNDKLQEQQARLDDQQRQIDELKRLIDTKH